MKKHHPTKPITHKYIQGENFVYIPNSDSEQRLVENFSGKKITHKIVKKIEINLPKTGFFNWKVEKKKQGRWKKKKNAGGLIQVDPSWITNAIVYSVFVRFFKGRVKDVVERSTNIYQPEGINSQEISQKTIDPQKSILPGEGGTFDDVKSHLDTLKSMGINTLYFNPIYSIGELYRAYNVLDDLPAYLQPGSPYSIKDYKSIDPELTYDKDTGKHLLSNPHQEFKDLVDAAHERGMYIILDLVFNHSAHDFVYQRMRPEWYLYKESVSSVEEPYLYPEDLKKGKPWGDAHHTFAPYDHGVWWEDCAQLNWEYKIPKASNEPPTNSSIDEMWKYFKSIPKYWIKHFGVDGFRCDVAYRVPPLFWRECIAESRKMAQDEKNNLAGDVVFIGESYTNDLFELQNAGFTAVYGDYSHKLNSPNNIKGYLDYTYNISGDHFPPGSKWFIFPDSHDFDRSPRKIISGEISKDKALLANQSRWVLTACLPGIPLIFNGFEKIEWQPINIFSYGAVDWERDVDLKKFIAKINHIRNRLSALQKGDYIHLHTNQGMNEDTQAISFLRKHKQDEVIVVVNMDIQNTAGPLTIYLPDNFSEKKYILTDQISKEKYSRQGKELMVKLNPGESHIFTVEFSS